MTELYRIKSLEWEAHPSDPEILGVADTAFGEYLLMVDNGTFFFVFEDDTDESGWVEYATLSDAKAAAESHWQSRIKECLEVAG